MQHCLQRAVHGTTSLQAIKNIFDKYEKYCCKTERFDAIFTGENAVKIKRPQTDADFSTPEFPIDDRERSE